MSIAARCLHGAGVCVLPSPANNHRPLALRHGSLSFLSGLLIAAKVLAIGVIALTPAPAELSTITANRIVQLTNVERKKAGLNELTVSSLLSNAAAQKGKHMLEEDYFAHISPGGVTPWFWMNKVGYTYQVAGENLAIDFLEAEDVVTAWLNSPTHRDNMLHGSYTETGVGVVTGEFQGGTSIIVVHMFGLPAGNPSSGAPPSGAKLDGATPTPSPSPSPVASPTPAAPPVPPADTTPPRTPRIALADPATTVRDTLAVRISGERNTDIALLVNNTLRQTIRATSDVLDHTLSLASLPDGTITVQAYALDSARNKSELSEILTLTKDTQGPRLSQEEISFVLSPQTDAPQASVRIAAAQYAALELRQRSVATYQPADHPLITVTREPLTLALRDEAGNETIVPDLMLTPDFSVTQNQAYIAPPSRLSQLTRRFAAAIFIVILPLLLTAIFVHIRIQHPTLIAHTSLVLLLAATFFLW